jgi:2-keto-4-pentenoate hydratase/2-oxohepta-3-ene-1,7-dioic acid hydratase in catechol pathway
LTAVSCQGWSWGPRPETELPELFLKSRKRPVPQPTKTIGMINNYPPADGSAPVAAPAFFVRSPNALAAHGDVLEIPQDFSSVLYEGELVIVIGETASRVSPEQAARCILGYTCGMDGSPLALDAEGKRDVARSLAGKSADGIAPVGPYVVDAIDGAAQKIELRVNGQTADAVSTAELIWKPERIIAEVSRTITLEPGDLIFTGARRAIPEFRPGDRVDVEISGIGILTNHIAGAAPKPSPDR